MKPSRDFDKDVKDAAPWEKRISEKIEDFLREFKARRLVYETSEGRKYQQMGIDFLVDSEESTHEVKTRDYEFYRKGILLETVSVIEDNILGWLYTSKADAIAYCWKNVEETNCMPVGYLILLKELRKTQWYKRLPKPYLEIQTKIPSHRDTLTGRIYWHTKFIVPPVKDFPYGVLYRFNATLPSVYKQTFFPVNGGDEYFV